MAEVNHLEPGIDPPESDRYVTVGRDVTGGFYVISSEKGYERGGPPANFPVAEAERDAVLERAKAFADAHGVGTVYVLS